MDTALLNLCKTLVATPSVTGDGTRRIAEFCAREILEPAGLSARLLPSPREGPEHVNLVTFAEGRNRSLTPLVLNTHLDTVPPGDLGLWTECGGNPFAATIKEDRIYGLGAADTKLDFAAKATALIQCGGRPQRDVYLVATFGEEHGLVGAKEIAAAGILPRGGAAFVGEPSHLQAVIAHKGLLAFELAVRFVPVRTEYPFKSRTAVFLGKAAHSSTPALGENAIVRALSSVASRPELQVAAIHGGDAVNKVPARCEVLIDAGLPAPPGAGGEAEHSEFIPADALAALSRFVTRLEEFTNRSQTDEPDFKPALTSNPAILRTHGDSLTLEFELRPAPGLPLDMVRRGVTGIVEALSQGAPNLKFSLTEKRANPGFRSEPASEAVELSMAAMAHAGIPLQTGVKSGCTEAGVYAAAGLRPIVFGPGPSTGVIHAPNEYNLLSEVEAATRFYLALLNG